MQWFYDLKIFTKLMLSCLLVLSLTIFLGVFATTQLADVNQTSTDMEVHWLPSTRATAEMSANIANARIAELQHIASLDEAEMASYEQQISKVFAALDKNRADFAALISSPEEQKLYDAFKRNWDGYLVEHEKLLALSRANNNDEAKALIRGKSQQQFDAASADLQKLADLTVAGGKTASHHGDLLYASSRLWIFGVLAGIVLLSFGCATAVARIVAAPLTDAVMSPEKWLRAT